LESGKVSQKRPISSVFLLDEDRVVTKACGLHHALATDALNIAHPATLIIDRNGWVRYIYRGDNQNDRAPLNEVLVALQLLGNNRTEKCLQSAPGNQPPTASRSSSANNSRSIHPSVGKASTGK